MGSRRGIVRHFNSRVQIMLFDWPESYCSPEHISRPSHTARQWREFGCTSRHILNTTDICLTAARGQMRPEFMRAHVVPGRDRYPGGDRTRALPTCAACRNRTAALPGSSCAALRPWSASYSMKKKKKKRLKPG